MGGPSTDPKLYFVTRTGLVTCMDATNYGFPPAGPTRWEMLLEAGVDYDLHVTEDSASDAGSAFLVDREGVVYCLNRITGARRWTHAELDAAAHRPDLVPGDTLWLNLDHALHGIGSQSCGPGVLPEHRLEAAPASFSLSFAPLRSC